MEYMGAGALDKLMKPRPFEEVYVAVLLREILKARQQLQIVVGLIVCRGWSTCTTRTRSTAT